MQDTIERLEVGNDIGVDLDIVIDIHRDQSITGKGNAVHHRAVAQTFAQPAV